ncbi:hypothetical protein B0J11DRAFT_15653 [Dendryphion nanum]|uniref:Uncharacterized protein n=1 Tax=Dendryphion nanum TaxID=256645 RepID=A0A9P9EFB8_9PLEO|nr:hypothetical protein B0J11DRAFT_15653 [Dendryphion nanum]
MLFCTFHFLCSLLCRLTSSLSAFAFVACSHLHVYLFVSPFYLFTCSLHHLSTSLLMHVSTCPPIDLLALCMPIFCLFTSSHLFTPLHTSSHLFTPLHTSSHLFTPLHTSSHLFTPLHTSSHLFTPLHTSSHLFTPLHTSSHLFTPLHTSSHLFTPLHTSSHLFTPLHCSLLP